MNLNGKRIDEIDIAKGIGILLVVLGHSIPDANTGIDNVLVQGIFNWIYSFHMALFMLFSGVLYWKNIEWGKGKNNKIASKRWKRLMIPYLFYSFLLYGGKSLLSTFSRKPVSIYTLIDIAVGNSPCGNCWFLYVLFVLSMIVLILPKKKFPEGYVIISLILYFFQTNEGWMYEYGISRLFNMSIWFALGLVIAKYGTVFWSKVRSVFWNKNICIMIILLSLQILLLNAQNNATGVINILLKLTIAMIGCFLTIMISCCIAKKDNVMKKWLTWLGKESMCIYLLSYFIQTPGIAVYGKFGNLGIPYAFWIIGLMVGAIAFSIFTSLIIKKNKILSALFIGV